MNFNNIAIIPHHGKITALVLIKLCKHFGLEYYVINDFDFDVDYTNELDFWDEEDYKSSNFYNSEIEKIDANNKVGNPLSTGTKKAMMTTNWKLLDEAGKNNIHFNIPKLEALIGYESNDKDSTGIWNTISDMVDVPEGLFPIELENFLEINHIEEQSAEFIFNF